jgi:hypothetical protein
MPKAKTVKRKDTPQDVQMYKKGGVCKPCEESKK